MFSFTLVALALMSAALAAGDLVTIHRESHTLTATNLPLTEDSNSSPGSKNSSLNTGVAKWLTQAVISISKREYHGISQSGGTYRGYLICSLRARSSMVEHKLLEIGVDRSNRSGLAISRDTRTVYRLVSGQVVILLILGLDYVEVRNLLSVQR